MEKWIEEELKTRWSKLIENPDKLEELLSFAKGNNAILSDISKKRAELLILETMRRDIEGSIKETFDSINKLEKRR